MKVLPFKIPKPQNEAFVFQVDREMAFYDKLHQHEEIQISYIVSGEGSLVIGDTINHYKSGDILVIDGNLPHVFKSDYTGKESYMLSLFFTKDSFGPSFFQLPEMLELKPFFKRCKHGFKVTSKQKSIRDIFLSIEQASKLKQFMGLMEILKLASSCSYSSLSSFVYNRAYTDNEGERMRNVIEYTLKNYKNIIDLNTISEVANMTKNAFCKYFKKRTNKTYIQFLNDIRIEHATKLLQTSSDLSIAEIAELSGFNNISNFNRQFKSIKRMNPSQIKKLQN
ncbi:AraC family transcriptional regulator [Hanstruepera marina]|uniref:AraC family transcriptional regulator n=1 Tax=Hanstruepera marina TaxID=2873265 RepID=UPI001CA618B2|nr:AraC family transcriptional regulator [Hanstruepera marina]